MAASESKSRVPDQPDENLPRPDNIAANGDAAEHLQKRDDVGLIRKEDNERVDLPASVRPGEKLIQVVGSNNRQLFSERIR